MKVLSVTGSSAQDPVRFARLLEGFGRTPPDYLEIRDKSATARTILGLLRQASEALPATRVLANDRFDLALAGGAAGVILPADGLPLADVRRETPRGFRVGKSTHSAREAAEALEEGADFVLIGPIFDTPSKRAFGPPLGPAALEGIPPSGERRGEVFAIGGVTLENVGELLPYRERFDGVAAIRLFEEADDASAAVEALREQ